MPSFFAPDYVHLTRQNASQSTLTSGVPGSETSDDGTTYLVDESGSGIVLMTNGDSSRPPISIDSQSSDDPTARLNGGGVFGVGGANDEDPSVLMLDFRKSGFWRHRTKLEKALLALVLICLFGFVCVVLILVTTSVGQDGKGRSATDVGCQQCTDGGAAKPQEPTQKFEICSSPGCVKAAANLLSSIDTEIDPCTNFFEYACGQWNRDHPIPDDMPGYGTFAQVRDVVKQQLRGLLEELNEKISNGSRAIAMAQFLYHSCMNVSWIDSLKSKPLLQALDEFGHWPLLSADWNGSLNLSDVLGRLRRDYSMDVFINLYVYADAKNTSQNVITIDQGTLGLGVGTRDYYLNDTTYKSQMKAYERYITSLATLLLTDISGSPDTNTRQRIKDESQKMIDFERQLANISSPEDHRRNHTQLYNKWTIKQLKETVTAIDWNAYFELIMPPSVTGFLRNDTIIIVSEPEYMKQLNEILLKMDSKILSNFLMWRLVKGWAKMLDTRYDDAFQDFVYVMMGRQQKPVRWKVCVPAAVGLMEMAAGALYVRAYFNEDDKREAIAMIDNLALAFKSLVEDLDWMDNRTKALAIQKSANMLRHIGYPDYVLNNTALDEYYEGLTVDMQLSYFEQGKMVHRYLQRKELAELPKEFDRNRFDTSPAIVNAFYSPEKNAITFPAGILQPPFFKGDYPKSVNYGAMGAVIGHEITHGFDDQGSQYDKDGNLFDWWSPMALNGFRERTQCVVDQYSNYVVPEVDAKVKVNGRLTQGENIADNGGVKEAFKAYRHYVKQQGREESRLPGLHNLTNDQIFFLSYANFWCGHKKPAAALQQVLTDPHAPEIFRVEGVLSNLNEFAVAFNCSIGTPMNPSPDVRKKCTVW